MALRTTTLGQWEVGPMLVPNVATDIYSKDAHIFEIHLVNETAGAVTVTINDKQSAPRAVVPTTVAVQANSDLVWEFTGRFCPGGLSWVASAASSITGYVRGR